MSLKSPSTSTSGAERLQVRHKTQMASPLILNTLRWPKNNVSLYFILYLDQLKSLVSVIIANDIKQLKVCLIVLIIS